MRHLAIFLLSITALTATTVFAAGDNKLNSCSYPKQIVAHTAKGYTAFWDLSETAALQNVLTEPDLKFTQYQNWVRAHTKLNAKQLLQNSLSIFQKAAAQTSDPSTFRTAIENLESIISGQIGHIHAINCIESIPFREFLNLVDLRKHSLEAQAFVLRKNGQVKILGDFYENEPDQGAEASQVSIREKDRLLSEGWELWMHYHNHPFVFHNPYGDIGGNLCPSDPDVSLYNSEKPELAVITNGVDTIDIKAEEFSSLSRSF